MLEVAVQGGDLDAVRRLLDAGLAVDGVPSDDDVPLGQAAWRGQPAIAEELLGRGAALFWPEGSALGAALHGSLHCHDPQGGPTMRTAAEIPRERYRALIGGLVARGTATPERLWPDAPSPETLLAELGVASEARPPAAHLPEP